MTSESMQGNGTLSTNEGGVSTREPGFATREIARLRAAALGPGLIAPEVAV